MFHFIIGCLFIASIATFNLPAIGIFALLLWFINVHKYGGIE